MSLLGLKMLGNKNRVQYTYWSTECHSSNDDIYSDPDPPTTFPPIKVPIFENEARPIEKIDSERYFWVKDKKSGHIYMAREVTRIDRRHKMILWVVTTPENSNRTYDPDEMLLYYEVIEEVCPPTTSW